MSLGFYVKKRARFLATKDAVLAKSKAKGKKQLQEGNTVIVKKGWRTLVHRPDKLLK